MQMKRTKLVFPLLVASTMSFAQANSSDWKTANVDPIAIAQKADATIGKLKGVDGAVSMRVQLGGLGRGVGYFVAAIASPKMYRVEYPRYVSTGFINEVLVRNGDKFLRFGRDVPSPTVKKNDSEFWISADASFVEMFPKSFSRQIFTPLVGGNATLTRFIKLAKKGTAGYRTKVETRTMTVPGSNRKLRNYRILVDRPAKGKLPKSHMELIFDADIGLPVNIQSQYGTFSAGWLVRWRNNQKFDPKLFKVKS